MSLSRGIGAKVSCTRFFGRSQERKPPEAGIEEVPQSSSHIMCKAIYCLLHSSAREAHVPQFVRVTCGFYGEQNCTRYSRGGVSLISEIRRSCW
jgi:hypothetical protein